MAKSRIYACLSADIVDSTSLSADNLKKLRREVEDVLNRVDACIAPVWGHVVRGDTIECLMENPSFCLRVALALKCYLKYWMSAVDASSNATDITLRYSIGVGTMRAVDLNDAFMDGNAIYMSGRNLDNMRDNRYSSFDCETGDKMFVGLVDLNLEFLDSIINDLSSRQAIVIYYKLLHIPEFAIAKTLGLSQPAVNVRANLGHWPLISRTLDYFENINFEDYVR